VTFYDRKIALYFDILDIYFVIFRAGKDPAVDTRVCWVPAAGLHTRIPAQHPRT